MSDDSPKPRPFATQVWVNTMALRARAISSCSARVCNAMKRNLDLEMRVTHPLHPAVQYRQTFDPKRAGRSDV